MRFLVLPVLVAATIAAAAAAAAPAPDGVVVFERRSGTAVADLYSIRPDGTGLRRITRTRNNFDPDVSADGRVVVFASHRTHGPGATELFVVRTDGTGLRRLTRNGHSARAFTIDADPAWSPDGETIVFSRTFVRGGRSSTDLFSVAAAGGSPQRLTYTAGRELSPTYALPGQIAFVRGEFVYQRVGTAQVRQQAGADPDWSPAHQFPAWSRDAAVYRSTLNGELRVDAGTDPAWSPDGQHLVWVTPLGLEVDGKRITRTSNLVHDLSPSWGLRAR